MKNHINALTSTRAFAAIMVFIFHTARFVYPFDRFPQLFSHGSLAVSYFFVLSGFVLYISYARQEFGYFSFLKKRVARLAPAYYLALGLHMVTYFYVYNCLYTPDLTWQLVYSSLFIQAYMPRYAVCLNTPAWSLCAEMLFYILFPLLLFVLKKNTRFFVWLTIAIFTITQVSWMLFFKHDWGQSENWNFFLYNPVMHINQFLIGMIGGFLFKKIGVFQKRYRYLPLFLLAVIVALVAATPDNIYIDAGLFAPLFMLFIISVTVNKPKFLNIKPLVFLGEISYGIYILQFPITAFVNHIDAEYKLFSPTTHFYVSLSTLILVSAMSYYLVERPLQRLIVSIGSRKKKPTALPVPVPDAQ